MNEDVVEIYKDKADEWRWRRLNGYNKQIVSVSGEGYINRHHVIEMARKLNEGVNIKMLNSNLGDAEQN